ncbi:MAG: hypothetical protein GY841_21635 [FCB group bacterium]|nr:hypothetical protein [FCB group bacterium]
MLINKMLKTAALGGLLIALTSMPAIGQIIYDQPTAGSINIEYIGWTVESDSSSTDISQLVLPISGFIPLQDNLEMRFSVANMSSSIDYGTDEYDLAGLNDIRLQVNKSLADDRLLLSLGVNLPTGKKELTLDEEYRVLQILSLNFLEFPIRSLGGGMGFNIMAGGATMAGDARLGLALTYQLNGSYTPYEDYDDYDPGDQFSVIAGADLPQGRHNLSAQAIYTAYTDDLIDGDKVFAQGDQFDLRLTDRMGGEAFAVEALVGMLFRGNNTRYDSTEKVIEQLKLYGNEFYLFGGVTWLPEPKWSVTPSMQFRSISDDDRDSGSSSLLGLGATVGRQMSEKAGLSFGLTYYTGSADGGDLDISGLRFSLGLSSTF